MSIRDRQQTIATDKVLQEELRDGNYPNLTTVQNKIAAMFSERPLGLSRFNFRLIEEDEVSNPDEYNTNMENIQEDLYTTFMEMGYHTDRMISIANLYETEKKGILLGLKHIENRMDTLLDKINNRSNGIYDTFNTFNQVDFRGNAARGIPKTNAFVDLRYGQVMLDPLGTAGIKYDISNAKYTVKSSIPGKEVFPLKNALKDSINESWQYTVESTTPQVVKVTVQIELPSVIECTVASMNILSPKESKVTLFVSSDNVIYKEIDTYTSYDYIEWKFDSDVKYLQIVIEKAEADFIDGTLYEYYFGATNISFKKEVYLEESKIVSNPYTVKDKIINQLYLRVDDYFYPQTNIKYYVGVDEPGEIIEWQEIVPDVALPFNKLNTKQLVAMDGTPLYRVLEGQYYGIDYYSVATITETPEPLTTKIYLGDYMWQVDTKLVPGLPVDFVPMPKDWYNINGVDTKFVSVEQTWGSKSLTLTPGSMQRLTTYIYCESDMTVFNNELTSGTATTQVYVNNGVIKPIEDVGHVNRYNYRFKAGWNKIDIFIAVREAAELKINLYLKDIATKIYAVKNPLQEVSIYDLINNTSKKNVSRFALNNGRIVMNYDPKELDINDKGIRYNIEYKYTSDNLSRDTDLRFMAVLSRLSGNNKVSPVLKYYQLLVE